MAGIGFELRRLPRDTIVATVASFGHAAVIAAGPWLFTILSLAAITLTTEQVAGLATLATFRVIVIYAFATSLVMTAPITIVATRLVANALWQRRPEDISRLLVGALALAVPAVGLAVAALALWFVTPAAVTLALFATSSIVGLIWVSLCFCGAIRDYKGVTLSFLLGLMCAVVAAIAAAILGFEAPGMIWGFNIGLVITFVGMTSRVMATFPHPIGSVSRGALEILEGLRGYAALAAGALIGTAGVWIDKWLFWSSSNGEAVEAGLLHAPLYDSAMFIASLALIPSLASFVVKLETDFFERYQRYYATISSHGTLGQIEEARARLARLTMDELTLITIAQIGYCAIVVLTAPLVVEALNLQFRQTSILRYGGLGAVFHFVFIAGTSIVLFFDRRRIYLGLQSLFLASNLLFTAYTLRLGEDFYGVGYFLACLLSAAVAYRMADVTLERLNFLTFIGNNPSVVDAVRTVRPWWRVW